MAFLPGDAKFRLSRALERPGCPICHENRDVDEHYFFWFFSENYYSEHTVEALTRSLGFCRAHGDVLARATSGGSQLRYVHEILVREVREALRAYTGPQRDHPRVGSALRVSGPCPACQNRRDHEKRNASWLSSMLDDVAGPSYGDPGILCFPHLRLVAPRVSDPTFLWLLRIHDSTIDAVQASLPTTANGLPGPLANDPEKRTTALFRTLALCIGHDRNFGEYPSVREHRPPAHMRNPVQELREALREDGCPICLEVRRAWLEWVDWLDRATPQATPIQDLLPTCAEHVWPVIRHAGASLALLVARHALEAVWGEILVAIPQFPAPPRRLWDRIDERLWGSRRRIETARQIIARGIACPVCRRVSIAEERALALLFALLEDRHDGTATANGYGLYLKHFARALAEAPIAQAQTSLVHLQNARLAALYWELSESGRKGAWQFRPEAKGTEETAWKRAVLRFSGSLTEHG